MIEPPLPPRPNLLAPLLIWLGASFVVGGASGWVATRYDVPFYFGFFLGFVLTGMCGLFALAAKSERGS
jgi:hypothetical protein